MILTIVFSGLFTTYAAAGGAHHVSYLASNPSQKSFVLKINWVSQVFSISAIASGKVSVALLIYRLQAPSKKRTWFLIFCAVSSILAAVGLVIALMGQCTPPEALWEGGGKCWDSKKVNNFDVAAACTDKLLPTELAASRSGICAIVKTAYVPTLTAKSDFTWITVTLLIWNA
ncbi:MAG: hypothetical protein Q9216_007132, partial [Gyalolechia sp. 2 TL-2023]